MKTRIILIRPIRWPWRRCLISSHPRKVHFRNKSRTLRSPSLTWMECWRTSPRSRQRRSRRNKITSTKNSKRFSTASTKSEETSITSSNKWQPMNKIRTSEISCAVNLLYLELNKYLFSHKTRLAGAVPRSGNPLRYRNPIKTTTKMVWKSKILTIWIKSSGGVVTGAKIQTKMRKKMQTVRSRSYTWMPSAVSMLPASNWITAWDLSPWWSAERRQRKIKSYSRVLKRKRGEAPALRLRSSSMMLNQIHSKLCLYNSKSNIQTRTQLQEHSFHGLRTPIWKWAFGRYWRTR